jgi:hypothetical protein
MIVQLDTMNENMPIIRGIRVNSWLVSFFLKLPPQEFPPYDK